MSDIPKEAKAVGAAAFPTIALANAPLLGGGGSGAYERAADRAAKRANARAAQIANARGFGNAGLSGAFQMGAVESVLQNMEIARAQAEERERAQRISGLASLGTLAAGIGTGNPALIASGAPGAVNALDTATGASTAAPPVTAPGQAALQTATQAATAHAGTPQQVAQQAQPGPLAGAQPVSLRTPASGAPRLEMAIPRTASGAPDFGQTSTQELLEFIDLMLRGRVR